MRVSGFMIVLIALIIALIALGHGPWQSFELNIFNFVVQVFTGHHVR